jgi:hypothetical protein
MTNNQRAVNTIDIWKQHTSSQERIYTFFLMPWKDLLLGGPVQKALTLHIAFVQTDWRQGL